MLKITKIEPSGMPTPVEEILVRRDGITLEEADRRIARARRTAKRAVFNGDYDSVEEIIQRELGLEMDYIMDVL